MSRTQSPTLIDPPSNMSMERMLGDILTKLQSIEISQNYLKRENENRVKEMSKLVKKLGYSGEVETDNDVRRSEITNDSSTDDEALEKPQMENSREQKYFQRPTAPIEEDKSIDAKLAIESIKILNSQDDMGVEDFIKSIKKAIIRCTQPHLLLDLIVAKKIQGVAKKATRYSQINSYEYLYESLRQNIEQSGSALALESKLESCKQGIMEAVQNFTLRFRQITNELNYVIQGLHTSPTLRRLRIKIEEEEHVSRYLLNLRKEIGLQVRLMKPLTLSEAQNQTLETEMWLKESHPQRTTQIPSKTMNFVKRPLPPSRPHANVTLRAMNSNLPLTDRSKMNCHKCEKLGHLAAQCYVRPKNSPTGQFTKRPPQPIRMIQETNKQIIRRRPKTK